MITDLERNADEIELKAREMFNAARLEGSRSSSRVHVGPQYHWVKPGSSDWKNLQRDVVRRYQEWYSTALQYVKACIPDREEEFTRYYICNSMGTSGILDALRLSIGVWEGNAAEAVDNYMEMFDMQRNLLLSIPSVVEAGKVVPEISLNPIDFVCLLCDRFQFVVRQLRDTRKDRISLDIKDEYDVQYLFQALLQLNFEDIRPEETTPTYAGGSAKMDFLLKK